jgi:hypothetical protein
VGRIEVVKLTAVEFVGFGKISRLYRDIVITEKIDGTNGAICIRLYSLDLAKDFVLPDHDDRVKFVDLGGRVDVGPDLVPISNTVNYAVVYAQSRKRIITPLNDNFGFAAWVWDNAETLVRDLGDGLHFGEWWGSGIQRGYGLEKGDKRFSLFNVKRWTEPCSLIHADGIPCLLPKRFETPNLGVVPVLYKGEFTTDAVNATLTELKDLGSQAVRGFQRPEGIVIYHTAANELFKVTVENDEKPKTLV